MKRPERAERGRRSRGAALARSEANVERALRRNARLRRIEAERELCPSGKRAYYDERLALVALEAAQRTGKTPQARALKRAYDCPDCESFHLTSRATWTP